jgi:DNA-binding response OmpR family regulator
MSSASILLIEGRAAGENSFAPILQAKGYRTVVVHSGREALQKLRGEGPGLVILDSCSLRSPGTRIIQALRRKGRETPLILVRPERRRAAAAPDALDVDAVLVYPFTPRKLLNHVARLAPDDGAEELTVGDLRLNLEQRCVRTPRRERHLLTPKQVKLLEVFMRKPGEVLSRSYLMKHVWNTDYLGDTRILDVHIRWVREIIEENPSRPRYLITVRGTGYRFYPSGGPGSARG